MSRSLCTNRAITTFFLPEARVIGGGVGVVFAGFCGGVAVGVIPELGEHPGTRDRSQTGLGGDDLSVGGADPMRINLPLQGLDLLLERGQHRHRGASRRRVGRGDHLGLTPLLGTQHGLDSGGLLRDSAAPGAGQRGTDLGDRQPRRRAGSAALANNSSTSAASRSSKASSAAGK
jgi:hypothetical protein